MGTSAGTGVVTGTAKECWKCGACCVAPDISALGKAVGVRCPHLTVGNLCAIYDRRPQICRDHKVDEVCDAIEAPTLDERVANYLRLFDLEAEIGRVPARRGA